MSADNSKNKIELMAPAGNFESLTAAIQGGADSVYFGVEQLNMRARATMNFTVGDLEEIAELCSKHNVRTYITLNTIVYDHDLALVKSIVDEVKRTGITAIIASDQAVISYAHSQGVEVHISTQLNVTNVETIRFYSHFADVMVLSRELSLLQMKKICDEVKRQNITGPSGELVQIEVFAHGALCMAVSGKCYLSLHSHNASANRGACVQNCRRQYKVIDLEEPEVEFEIDNEYIMSPKDLCTIDFLDQLLDTGVTVLKLEGRGKAADYVKTVTQCYREAIDAYNEGTYSKEKAEQWMETMKTVFNREFWGGYYLGQKMGEWTDSSGSKATQKKLFIGKGVHYYSNIKVGEFKMESYSLKVGDKVMIIGPTTGVVETTVEELHLDRKSVTEVKKGDNFTMPIDEIIRASDKVYKIVEA
ncbi:peptidase U32 family protein [Aureibacter tunicatorum]|uniref:Protease n=1 Tax=Aureibacter tunicatorum TaxID=866807 RepID=A0AAE4BT80_9BACT|nr:peptidase U32 family protein [Aureibacter tunicatorum]MDR6239578.1 putative protease [Aureibacter tunicatorum]BDD04055.1 collagenase [Aureibacter tunicatorum]